MQLLLKSGFPKKPKLYSYPRILTTIFALTLNTCVTFYYITICKLTGGARIPRQHASHDPRRVQGQDGHPHDQHCTVCRGVARRLQGVLLLHESWSVHTVLPWTLKIFMFCFFIETMSLKNFTIVMVWSNIALWMDVASHVTCFNQLFQHCVVMLH